MTTKIYTIAEVAEACKVARGTLYRAIDAGELKAFTIDSADQRLAPRDKWRVTHEELIAYKRWRTIHMGDYYPELDQAQ